MKIVLVLLGFVVLVLVIIVYGNRNNSPDSKVTTQSETLVSKVTINSATFKVTLSNTPEKQIKGLSGVTSLPEGHGMLFVFDKPGNNSFWMHGMKFPLDIIFILDDRVVGVYENLPPADDRELNPPQWGGDVISDRALEINAGMVKKFNIKVGDKVSFQIK